MNQLRQRTIVQMAGLLSTFPGYSDKHPKECLPIAEKIYDEFMEPEQSSNAKVLVCQVGIVERYRQDELKQAGKFMYTCADKEIGHAECLAVLLEEIGECAEALEPKVEDDSYRSLIGQAMILGMYARRILNAKRLATDPDGGLSHTPDRDLKKELVQSFAVIMAWLEGFEEKTV